MALERNIGERLEQTFEEEKTTQLVGFIVNKEYFGVNILDVQEIIRSIEITEVPNSPDFIEGVINLRGNIIPVMELRKRLNLPDRPEEMKEDVWILIINIEDRVTGFIVDEITKVLRIDVDAMEPTPEIVGEGLKSQYITGVCEIEERLHTILNFEEILQIKEIEKIKDLEKLATTMSAKK